MGQFRRSMGRFRRGRYGRVQETGCLRESRPGQAVQLSGRSPPASTSGERGKPCVQYERTYVLLPPDADASWAQAVAEGAWDIRRYTIGGSADDAGSGDLDVRRVIAVNPQKWTGGNLEDFFRQYYPGVEYKSLTAATPAELRQKLAGM